MLSSSNKTEQYPISETGELGIKAGKEMRRQLKLYSSIVKNIPVGETASTQVRESPEDMGDNSNKSIVLSTSAQKKGVIVRQIINPQKMSTFSKTVPMGDAQVKINNDQNSNTNS